MAASTTASLMASREERAANRTPRKKRMAMTLSAGHVLEHAHQGDEEEGGTRRRIDLVGEGGRHDDQGRHEGHGCVQSDRVQGRVGNIEVLLQVAPVHQHPCPGEGHGEERLAQGHAPGDGLEEVGPVRDEEVSDPLHGARKGDGPDQEDRQESQEEGHHDLGGPLDSLGDSEDQDATGEDHGQELPADALGAVRRIGVK